MIVTGCRFDGKKIDKFYRCSAKFAALYHILNIRLYLFNTEIREVLQYCNWNTKQSVREGSKRCSELFRK